jgi:hypothetical protein
MKLAYLKMAFGFALLGILSALAYVIAIGTVKSENSFGLMPIIVAIAGLAGGFSGWSFKDSNELPKQEHDKDTD